MKKLAFLIVMILACVFGCMTVFAEDTQMNINKVTVNETGSVDIEGSITSPITNQQITIMCSQTVNGTYDASNIDYINQYDYEDISVGNGEFKINFIPKEVLGANKEYIVRLGGSNVVTATYLIFVIDSGGNPSLVYGDADGDGALTATDAAWVMQYVLNSTIFDDKIEDMEGFLVIINVTGGDTITAEQAGYIMQKVLDTSFTFPVEQQ